MEDEFEGGEQPQYDMGGEPDTISEMFVWLLSKSRLENGRMATRSLYSALDMGRTMLGSVMDDEGSPKFTVDAKGDYEHPVLKRVFTEAYSDAITPPVKGDFAGGSGKITIEVGSGFFVRGTEATSQMVTAEAMDYLYEIHARKLHQLVSMLCQILGEEDLLPPHTQLGEVGMQRTLQHVIGADLNMLREMEQMAHDIAGEEIGKFVEEFQEKMDAEDAEYREQNPDWKEDSVDVEFLDDIDDSEFETEGDKRKSRIEVEEESDDSTSGDAEQE